MLDPKLTQAIRDALAGGPLTMTRLRPKVALYAATDRQIKREVDNLVKGGTVTKSGSKKGTTYQLREVA